MIHELFPKGSVALSAAAICSSASSDECSSSAGIRLLGSGEVLTPLFFLFLVSFGTFGSGNPRLLLISEAESKESLMSNYDRHINGVKHTIMLSCGINERVVVK